MFLIANSVQPWNSTTPTLVLFQNCKTLNDVKQIHARLLTTGFINNANLTTKLILTLSSSPNTHLTEFARHIFFTHHTLGDREDPFLWNAIIRSYSHGSDPKRALEVFCLMLENGVIVDGYSFSLVLKACSRLGLVKEGMKIHGLLRKSILGSDLYLQNCLISWYLRCGCCEFARQVFDRMSVRDVISYNSMIDGYVKGGKVGMARAVFDSMPVEERNLISWNTMLNGYAELEDGFDLARKLFEEMPERDLVSWNTMVHVCVKCGRMGDALDLFNKMPLRDAVTWGNMIDGYAKIGSVDVARSFFDRMPNRDVVACNAMMVGYVQNGLFAEALEVFYDMQTQSDLLPDHATLLIVLSAVAQSGHLDEGIALHSYIMENGFSLDGKLGVALIDMYSKCGCIEKAISIFNMIEEKWVDHWNAMIGGLAVHGMGELAFDLFINMERLSVKPDDITFIGMLNACGHSGLLKEGLMCFEIMRRVHNLIPKLQHYGCMVDILCRAGYLEVAKKFIEEMPLEPNEVIWRTLLSACKLHENFEIGKPVAHHLIGMDSTNSSSYILLSHIYAGLGLWKNVSRIRNFIKERKMKKEVGCSWIELEGILHEFSVQDKSHPQVAEIYSLLDISSMACLEVPCHSHLG